MKLTCDLCGGELQMKAGGNIACCLNCGLEYPRERLQEILRQNQSTTPPTPVQPVPPTPSAPPVPPQPRMRTLHLKRKFNLSGCAAKVAVYLDGQLCAVLTARGEANVPISEGSHEIFVRLMTPVPLDLQPLTFQVTNRDVYGLFYLRQTAFSGKWMFELCDGF